MTLGVLVKHHVNANFNVEVIKDTIKLSFNLFKEVKLFSENADSQTESWHSSVCTALGKC